MRNVNNMINYMFVLFTVALGKSFVQRFRRKHVFALFSPIHDEQRIDIFC